MQSFSFVAFGGYFYFFSTSFLFFSSRLSRWSLKYILSVSQRVCVVCEIWNRRQFIFDWALNEWLHGWRKRIYWLTYSTKTSTDTKGKQEPKADLVWTRGELLYHKWPDGQPELDRSCHPTPLFPLSFSLSHFSRGPFISPQFSRKKLQAKLACTRRSCEREDQSKWRNEERHGNRQAVKQKQTQRTKVKSSSSPSSTHHQWFRFSFFEFPF